MSAASAACVSWYPQGHNFSVEERKQALAAFAVKLGLADAKIEAAAKPDCGRKAPVNEAKPATDVKATAEPLKPAAVSAKAAVTKTAEIAKSAAGAPVLPPVPAPKPVLAAAGTAAAIAAPTAGALAAEAQAIEVRKSEVHAIDPQPVAEPAASPAIVASAPQVLASVTPAPSLAPQQRGASTCLSVESDGMHWGFRNHCTYSVQFAYCVMAGSQLASCRDGAVAGSVAGNGFGALVADESLKESDAKHDFRWVACQGGAGEVIPHLDQIDPPSGRCVR